MGNFYLTLSPGDPNFIPTVGILAICGFFVAFGFRRLSSPRPVSPPYHNRQLASYSPITFVSRLHERESILALMRQEIETVINGRKPSQLTKADRDTIADIRQFYIDTLRELSH